MPTKGKDGKYHSKVVPAPGVKPIYFEAASLKEFNAKREKILREYVEGRQTRDVAFVAMIDEWYEVVKKPRIRTESTRHNYNSLIRRVRGAFSPSLLCRAVRYPQLQRYADTLAGECAANIAKILYILRSVCGYAVAEGAMEYNYALSLQKPIAKKQTPRGALSGAQAASLLQAAKAHPFGIAVMIAYYTGMRQGEVLGLRWRDVDFKRQQISVTQAKIGHARIGENVGGLKTAGSERIIPLPPELTEFLLPLRGMPDAYCCPPSQFTSSSLTQHTLRPRLDEIYLAAGLAHEKDGKVVHDITLHWLRHNYATACYRAGVPLTVAMQWLGHTNMNTTVSVYADIKSTLKKGAFSENQDDHLRDVLKKVGQKLDVWAQAW